ncbi:MAG: peptide chain release factor N(5)-glutamine methyltransferase [Candidatus Tectomicrobia bacterium]|nr:peptide chain release factor N(5)-glutamine methyltransferase [Candidatus Tectomicrobia bacterium]
MPRAHHTDSLTLRQVVAQATTRLLQAGVSDTPRLDAEILFAHLLRRPREFLYREADWRPAQPLLTDYEDLLRRRLAHEPVAYITGKREFWSMTFRVTPDVLIPRPETERLVESLLEAAAVHAGRGVPLRLLDVGTGSGIIAISAARELPAWQVVALDASRAALRLAQENARRLIPERAVAVLAADVFALPFAAQPFAMVAANLPYVATAEVALLPREVHDYEPRSALDGGPDGLRCISALLGQAPRLLIDGGSLHLEVGLGQVPALRRLIEGMPWLSLAKVLPDLAGIERVAVLRYAQSLEARTRQPAERSPARQHAAAAPS